MIRISIPFFYGFGAAMRQISGLQAGTAMVDAWPALSGAERELNNLFATDWFLPAVRNAWNPGQTLLRAISAITQQTDFQKNLEYLEVYHVTAALIEFETVLRNELFIADVYFVTRKAGFDTSILISNAEVNFAKELPFKVSEAIPDIREAGMSCLRIKYGFWISCLTRRGSRCAGVLDGGFRGETSPETEKYGRLSQENERRQPRRCQGPCGAPTN